MNKKHFSVLPLLVVLVSVFALPIRAAEAPVEVVLCQEGQCGNHAEPMLEKGSICCVAGPPTYTKTWEEHIIGANDICNVYEVKETLCRHCNAMLFRHRWWIREHYHPI